MRDVVPPSCTVKWDIRRLSLKEEIPSHTVPLFSYPSVVSLHRLWWSRSTSSRRSCHYSTQSSYVRIIVYSSSREMETPEGGFWAFGSVLWVLRYSFCSWFWYNFSVRCFVNWSSGVLTVLVVFVPSRPFDSFLYSKSRSPPRACDLV